MLTVLLLIGVLVVLFVVAALATTDRPLLADAPPDAADVGLPAGPLAPEDVAGLRFAVAPRGYRMAEVDEVLDRLGAELADRDRRLAVLEGPQSEAAPAAPAVAAPAAPAPIAPAPAPAAPAAVPEMWDPQQSNAGDSPSPGADRGAGPAPDDLPGQAPGDWRPDGRPPTLGS